MVASQPTIRKRFMSDQLPSNNLSHSRWLQPKYLVLFVILVGVLVAWLATIDWSSLQTQPNFTIANVNVAPVDEAKLVRSYSPVFGKDDAPIVIVEFSDFQCPFCKESFSVVRAMLSKYGDQVQYVYRNFPVDSLHPNARMAAEAAMCANEQNKFLEYHDRLFINQNNLNKENLLNYASQSGLDVTLFTQCLNSAKYKQQVEQDLADGVALGVRATPTWFINSHKKEGAIPQEIFFKAIDELLAQGITN